MDTINQVNHNTVPVNSHNGAKSLKKLSKEFLGIVIQEGAHSSVIDARASLALYRIQEKEWENQIKQKKDLNYKNVK